MRTRRKPRRRFRFGRLALVLVVVAATGGAVYGLHTVQTQRNAGSLLVRAEQATADGDLAAAARHYKSYVRMRPADADAAGKYAATLEGLTKTKPATLGELVQAYERLLRVDPNRAADRKRLAELYLQTQAYANARSHLAVLFGDNKGSADDPALHDLAAQCDERERKFPSAADHLRKVVAAGNAAPDVYARLAALVHTELGGADAVAEADGLMASLVAKRPNDPKAWLSRSDYRRRYGDKAGARQDAEHVYRTLPGGADDPEVLQTLADLSLEADDLETAERMLQKVAGGATSATRTRLTLADLQVRDGRLDTARQTLKDAAEKATAADVYLLEVVDRLIDLKELTLAEKQIDRLAPLAVNGPVAEYVRGRIKLAAGEWTEATPLLRTAADGLERLTNQRFRAYLGLAAAAEQANDLQGRLDAFDGALRVLPAAGVARLGRAESLAKLGRRKEAEEAYRGLTGQEPAARAAVANLRLAEQLARPPAERSWEAVDVLVGGDRLTAEVAVVKAKSLVARGRTAEAVALLDDTARQSDLPEAVVELAALKSATGDRAGAFAVLDQAETRKGVDPVAFRLARARLLAADKTPDWAAVAALGEPAAIGQMPRDERYKLLAGLADVSAGGGRTADAVALWKRAAAEKPTDLTSRAALFNAALAAGDAALQAELMAEFERIEGKDGPVRTTAAAAQAVPGLKPTDAAEIARWKERLTAARGKRAGWGLVHHLLGRLELLSGNGDAAAEAFRRAFDLGDRSEGLLRGLYAALLGRQRYAEAFDLLGRASREKPLPADLAKEYLRLQVAFGDDPARAVAWARSAEAVNSANDQDHVLRADAMLAAGQAAEALGPLKKAVGLNPTNAVAWAGLCRVLAALGKDAEAKAAATDAAGKLEQVKAPPAARAAALTATGACWEVVGNRDEAEKAYRAAAAADPADIPAHLAVARLLTRANRGPDAEAFLRGLGTSAPPAVRRWARRELAFASLDRPDWYGRLAGALALVEENLKEGGNLPEDVRAKAVILGADPFRVAEAVGLLADSAKDAPLTADQSYQLARLYQRQARPDKAEAALKEAIRSAPVADPELLGLLVKVQINNRTVAAARQTADRLKQIDPKGTAAGIAEARVLAAEDKKPAAAARLAAVAGTADPTAVARFAGPLLEEMGCPAEAEAVYRRATDPLAPVKLAGLLLRQKKPDEAVKVLMATDPKTPVGPVARLLAGAVRSSPPALLPEPERSNWERTAREVAAWVNARAEAAPNDPQLLAAKATLAVATGRPEQVVPAFERALAAAPDDPTAKANLAFARAVYARDGSDATLALAQAALDQSGPAPALLDTRAVVHLVAGRAEPAIRDLSAALTVDPKPAFAFHLAQAYDLAAGEKPEYARLRDDTLADAIRRKGLTKAVLDPREWAEFERLTKPAK